MNRTLRALLLAPVLLTGLTATAPLWLPAVPAAWAAPAVDEMRKMLKVVDDRQMNSGDYKALFYIQQKSAGKADLIYQGVVYRRDEADKLVILFLKPQSEAQADDKARAAEFAVEILHDRWMLQTERAASTPTVFLFVVLAWLALEFFVFGLFVSHNAMVILAELVGALIVASAMFLVLDLEGVMTGPMRISTASLERAVALMGQ
ncbi:MAG: hypothetical protein ACKOBP_15745 [Planctomycetia bacterium]